MRYHGNIKIWKENFNQSWGNKIIPRVKGLDLQSGFMGQHCVHSPTGTREKAPENRGHQPHDHLPTEDTVTQVCESLTR